MLYEDFSKSELQKNTLNVIKSTQSCNTFSIFQVNLYIITVNLKSLINFVSLDFFNYE